MLSCARKAHTPEKSNAWGVLLLAAFLSACSTMQTEVTINAPAAKVWAVLTDVDAYSEWNPFFVKAKGKLVVGGELDITMQPVGKSAQSFSPKVLELEQQRKLVWRGRVGIPGLFDGTHSFVIERVGDATVKFRQHEDFSGILVPFVGFDPYRKGWAKMNAALKQRCERAEPPSASQPSSSETAKSAPAH